MSQAIWHSQAQLCCVGMWLQCHVCRMELQCVLKGAQIAWFLGAQLCGVVGGNISLYS